MLTANNYLVNFLSQTAAELPGDEESDEEEEEEGAGLWGDDDDDDDDERVAPIAKAIPRRVSNIQGRPGGSQPSAPFSPPLHLPSMPIIHLGDVAISADGSHPKPGAAAAGGKVRAPPPAAAAGAGGQRSASGGGVRLPPASGRSTRSSLDDASARPSIEDSFASAGPRWAKPRKAWDEGDTDATSPTGRQHGPQAGAMGGARVVAKPASRRAAPTSTRRESGPHDGGDDSEDPESAQVSPLGAAGRAVLGPVLGRRPQHAGSARAKHEAERRRVRERLRARHAQGTSADSSPHQLLDAGITEESLSPGQGEKLAGRETPPDPPSGRVRGMRPPSPITSPSKAAGSPPEGAAGGLSAEARRPRHGRRAAPGGLPSKGMFSKPALGSRDRGGGAPASLASAASVYGAAPYRVRQAGASDPSARRKSSGKPSSSSGPATSLSSQFHARKYKEQQARLRARRLGAQPGPRR